MIYAGQAGVAERDRLDAIVGEVCDRYRDEAENLGLFPRGLVKDLAATGIFRERWAGELHTGNAVLGLLLAERVANQGVFGLSTGLSLQVETIPSALRRFGRSDEHAKLLEAVLDGNAVGAFGASEPIGGSDLASIATEIAPAGAGRITVRGEKKYLSLGEVCDFAVILGRYVAGSGKDGVLTTVVVPKYAMTTVKRHSKVGTSCLDTSWVHIDAELPADAILGRIGAGLAVASWSLMHERLSIAAQVVGGCRFAIGMATAHAIHRTQFGRRLLDHQALRMRLAELSAQVTVLEFAVYGAGERLATPFGCTARDIAGIKVIAARLAERVTSECMHIFGGAGYLEDETPMGKLWRDSRLARLGGGSDEMMLEMVAGDLRADNRYTTQVSAQ